jgi:L-amino acid N-acyltransferase YncA
MIRPACASDADTIARIYNHYVANTIVTFEEEAVSPGQISDRINETRVEGLPWLVAEDDGAVVGYAYASKWKGRCAYRHSVEVTVYLSHLATSRGWGSSLYTALFSELEALGVHVAIGGIALPNEASIALHEKFGMGKVAHFQEIGFKFGQWVDVGYWQKKLPT